MQMIKNTETLGRVHTHTSNLKTKNQKYKSNTNKPIKI